MNKVELEVAFQDERGEITDLIENEEISAITRITFTRDAVRANHYHKKTWQWNYIISGEILLATRMPGEEKKEAVMAAGELYVTVPDEEHALKCLSDTADLLVFTKGPRAGKEYQSDTYRLDTPLL